MHPSNPAPSPRYLALLQLLRTSEALWNASRVFFGRWGLSPSQFNVLNLLHNECSGHTQTELSRQLIMNRSNVTGLIDRLERRGLVQRGNDSQDRRTYHITITANGRNLMRQILPHYYEAAEKVWGDLSVNRAGRLVADLAQVSANSETIARNLPGK